MELSPVCPCRSVGRLKIQAEYREPWLWPEPEPCGAQMAGAFPDSDAVVNNNKKTNNRGYDRPSAKTTSMNAYRQAQFASFNFTNALICGVASSTG